MGIDVRTITLTRTQGMPLGQRSIEVVFGPPTDKTDVRFDPLVTWQAANEMIRAWANYPLVPNAQHLVAAGLPIEIEIEFESGGTFTDRDGYIIRPHNVQIADIGGYVLHVVRQRMVQDPTYGAFLTRFNVPTQYDHPEICMKPNQQQGATK